MKSAYNQCWHQLKFVCGFIGEEPLKLQACQRVKPLRASRVSIMVLLSYCLALRALVSTPSSASETHLRSAGNGEKH